MPIREALLFQVKKHKRIAAILVILALAAGASVMAFLIELFISYRQPLALPIPTGPYPVGRSVYDWVDTSRIDPLSNQAGQKRELLVWVWYPAESTPNPAVPYLPSNWASAQNQEASFARFLEHDLSAVRTHAVQNAPFSSAPNAFPVLVMQPGMGRAVPDYTAMAEDLASHGYVVFGVNPTFSSDLIVFPDGHVVTRTAQGMIPENGDAAAVDTAANRIQTVWAGDEAYVMDKVGSLDADPTSRFYNRLDMAQIGLFGHSFGGATAIRVCQEDARCQAAADLDGFLFSNEVQESIRKPALFLTEETCGKLCDVLHTMAARAAAPLTLLTIQGTQHFNFSDMPLLATPIGRLAFRLLGAIGPIQPQRGLDITNAYLLAFFDQTLKGTPTQLLQSPSPAYPEVQFEKP